MDYFLRRERRRLIEDLIDLQSEEDLLRQHQYILRGLERSIRYDYDDDDDDDDDDDKEYRNSQHQRKEYSLVKVIYQNPKTRQRRYIDEIMIIQHNRTIFKGCLQDGDELTFKSKRYQNDSKLKLKFYVNDVLEDEMIACCEHGLINRNRRHHVFQIESITGARPCYDCENNEDSRSSSPISPPSKLKHPSTKTKTYPPSHVLTEDQPEEQISKTKKPAPSNLKTNKPEASSESFSPDITKVPNFQKQLNDRFDDEHQSDEDSVSDREFQPKPAYGPPQLSTMLSVNESSDLVPPINQSKSENLFNSSANTQQKTAALTNSNLANNPSESDKHFSRQSSIINTNQTELSLNSSNNKALAEDATQVLMTRLGIVPQSQIEQPKTVIEAPPREKGNVEYFILIYLHETQPEESVIKHLRSLVNFLKIFDDADDCIAFINTISNEKILLILSSSFRKLILPKIKELQQIYTIYFLSEKENDDDSPLKPAKVQGFYTDINQIYEPITNDINKISRDLVIYLNTSSNVVTMEQVVEYFLLLNEIILDKTDTKDNIKELTDFARQEYEGNDEELKIIDEFENTYQKNQAIYWFSRQCFISKMLNKALRIPEPDILFRFRLFIQDLYYQTENESISESTTVFLGQTIQRQDLNDLQINISNNDIIIFPQFLFGSTDQSRAIRIAKEIPALHEDVIPLLIQVEISEDMKCANLNSQRYSIDEDNNVLLNMSITGRLIKIEKDNIREDDIALIHVRLVKPDSERNIHEILEISRAEIKSFSPFVTMIKLMIKMNQHASAEKLIQTLFNDENFKTDANFQGSIAASCHLLAQSRRSQEDYKRALDLYLISLESFHRIISPNSVELSSLYSNIGSMYFRLENYEKAHEFFQKAIDTQLHSLTPDLYSVSTFTNSIGHIHSREGKYSEAIKLFERTLKILQQSTEPHDAEIAATHDDLGDANILLLKYDEALKNYCKSIEIQERIEPRNRQTLGTSYHTVGNIYLKLGRSKEALVNLKNALENLQQVLPLTHPTFALLYNNIGLMYYREEEYSEALKCYSKALEVAAVSLPENHSLVGTTLFNIGLVYSSQGKFEEAIESIEKSSEQFLKTLPADHSDIVDNKKFIESIKQKKVLKNILEDSTINF